MNLTKDQVALLRHGLDMMCRAEANGAAQGGLNALKANNAAAVIGARLAMAVELEGMLEVELGRIIEEEAEAVAAASKAEKAN